MLVRNIILLILAGVLVVGGVLAVVVLRPWEGGARLTSELPTPYDVDNNATIAIENPTNGTYFDPVPQYEDFANTNTQESDVRGNTAGNIVNWGLVAQSGDWIYYQAAKLPERIDFASYYHDVFVRKNIVSGDTQILIEQTVASVNVVEEQVFFVKQDNETGINSIYSMSTDGTGLTALLELDYAACYLSVVGGWLYFLNNQHRIYRMRKDGSELERLNDDESSYMNVVDGWIYFSNMSNNAHIYKIRIDGTERTLLNKDASEFLNVVDGWIYYSHLIGHPYELRGYPDGRAIYKIRTDGTERQRVTDDAGIFLNVFDGWMYYSNLSNNSFLYRIRVDGSGREVFRESPAYAINIVDNWVYFCLGIFPDVSVVVYTRMSRDKMDAEWLSIR